MESAINKEAKEYFKHEKAPALITMATSVKGLLQVRVLELANDHAKIGLCIVSEDDTNRTLKILGEPKWVKVDGKITLHGAPVDMNFNRNKHG